MYYRQPRYFNDFKCAGGTCSYSCCIGWRIDWEEQEVDKVKNAPGCSQELKDLCEKCFEYREETKKYAVVLGEKDRCPFLTEDNFCKIQRELGAEYLSHTCASYPRSYLIIGDVAYRHCNMSCPEIMKKLFNDAKSMDMLNADIRTAQRIIVDILNNPESVAEHPELKYAAEIKEFFYDIISDKKLPLETSIILGALAAQSLTKIVNAKQYDMIPEALKSLRAQMHNGAQLKSIENINPNYNIKLGIVDKLLREVFSTSVMVSLNDDEGVLNIDIYRRAEYLLEKEFESRPFVWRNIALNLLLELKTPFKLKDNTIFENYSLFVISYALIRHNALTVVEFNDRADEDTHFNTQEAMFTFNSALSRRLCHNNDRLKIVLKRLQDFKISSPAYLALLVK